MQTIKSQQLEYFNYIVISSAKQSHFGQEVKVQWQNKLVYGVQRKQSRSHVV